MARAETNIKSRGLKPAWMDGPGPYIGTITNHLDPTNMGIVEVEILKIAGAGNETSETSSGYTIPCEYVSPFYGVTPRSGVSENEGFDYTQQSYGMWAIPPDIGVKVLVFFAQGNYGNGYWFGCIQDKNMNFMLPGHASTTYNSENKSKPRPVGEYNKKTESGSGKDATQYVKPCWKDQCEILDNQGLADDHTRGTNTSSARREVPSMVFGISTPGPYDRRSGKPKVNYGEKFSQAQVPFNRLGGSTIVMDDGDMSLLRKDFASSGPSEYANAEAGESGKETVPHNELLRLRTRTGHQILLHNSEDLIYIAHGSGQSWIEMTSNGKIDIYSKDSISIRTENDLNLKAERDINFEATNNVNFKAGAKMSLQSTADFNIKSGAGLNIESTGELNGKSGAGISLQSSSAFNLKSGAALKLGSAANFEVSAGADGIISAGGSNNLKSSAHKITAGAISFNGAPASAAGGASGAGPAEDAKTPVRLPSAEPWGGHENFGPEDHTPDKTDSSSATTSETGSSTVRDTFRKSI